jgi:hypothetical protein
MKGHPSASPVLPAGIFFCLRRDYFCFDAAGRNCHRNARASRLQDLFILFHLQKANRNYRKSLELNPANTNTARMLEQLEGE